MLTEISRFGSLGDYSQIKYLLTELILQEPRTLKEVEDYFLYNNEYNTTTVRGAICFLVFIKVLEFKNNYIVISPMGLELKHKLEKSEHIHRILIEMLIEELVENNLFLFSGKVKYDSNRDLYIIKNNDFPLKYSNIRNMFIKLGLFSADSYSLNNLIVNSDYIDILKRYLYKTEKKMSLDKLKQLLEVQQKYGEEAEVFVLNYEKNRLRNLTNNNKVKRISEIDTQAGYDIISFNSIKSNHPDRFIEVKSYISRIEFYWTKNELEISKEKEENYFIYLVDRLRMCSEDYIPYIIQNPYYNIYCNDNWIKSSEKWHIKPLNL